MIFKILFTSFLQMVANLEGEKLRDQITDWANSVVENVREVKDGVMYCVSVFSFNVWFLLSKFFYAKGNF